MLDPWCRLELKLGCMAVERGVSERGVLVGETVEMA